MMMLILSTLRAQISHCNSLNPDTPIRSLIFCDSGDQALQLLFSKPLLIFNLTEIHGVKGTLGQSHGTKIQSDFFHSICISFWHMGLVCTQLHSQNNLSWFYSMVSKLLHKFRLNIKRCLLNESYPILCPNSGNIRLLIGVSLFCYLQRDICAPETDETRNFETRLRLRLFFFQTRDRD